MNSGKKYKLLFVVNIQKILSAVKSLNQMVKLVKIIIFIKLARCCISKLPMYHLGFFISWYLWIGGKNMISCFLKEFAFSKTLHYVFFPHIHKYQSWKEPKWSLWSIDIHQWDNLVKNIKIDPLNCLNLSMFHALAFVYKALTKKTDWIRTLSKERGVWVEGVGGGHYGLIKGFILCQPNFVMTQPSQP